jgi:hypothetical protein
VELRGPSDRALLAILGVLAATSVAAVSGWISHDALGYDWSDIREAALLGATLAACGYVWSFRRSRGH